MCSAGLKTKAGEDVENRKERSRTGRWKTGVPEDEAALFICTGPNSRVMHHMADPGHVMCSLGELLRREEVCGLCHKALQCISLRRWGLCQATALSYKSKSSALGPLKAVLSRPVRRLGCAGLAGA